MRRCQCVWLALFVNAALFLSFQVLTPDLTWHDFDYEAAENPCADVLCKPHASCSNIDGAGLLL